VAGLNVQVRYTNNGVVTLSGDIVATGRVLNIQQVVFSDGLVGTLNLGNDGNDTFTGTVSGTFNGAANIKIKERGDGTSSITGTIGAQTVNATGVEKGNNTGTIIGTVI
jgi:hypothetical protein